MKEISEGQGRTVLFVSHNMNSIGRLCTSAVSLDKGQIGFQGETAATITQYLSASKVEQNEQALLESSFLDLLKVELRQDNDGTDIVHFGEAMELTFTVNKKTSEAVDLNIGLSIERRLDQIRIFGTQSVYSDFQPLKKSGPSTLSFRIPKVFFAPGEYAVSISVDINRERLKVIDNLVHFTVISASDQDHKCLAENHNVGTIYLPHHWNSQDS